MPAAAAAPASFGIHHAVDLNQPIACGDVAVFPGDVLVGDREGVVVIPRHLADEVARDGAEQEQLESWILKEVKAGKGIFGLYPPDDATRARYQAWRESLHERQTWGGWGAARGRSASGKAKNQHSAHCRVITTMDRGNQSSHHRPPGPCPATMSRWSYGRQNAHLAPHALATGRCPRSDGGR